MLTCTSAPASRTQSPEPRDGREEEGGGSGQAPAVTAALERGATFRTPGTLTGARGKVCASLLFWGCSLRAAVLVSLSNLEIVTAQSRGGEEGEGRRGTPSTLLFQLDTHAPSPLQTPQAEPAAGSWPRATPGRPGSRSPRGRWGARRRRAPLGRGLAPQSPSPQRDASKRRLQPGRARGARGQGREMRTRSARAE